MDISGFVDRDLKKMRRNYNQNFLYKEMERLMENSMPDNFYLVYSQGGEAVLKTETHEIALGKATERARLAPGRKFYIMIVHETVQCSTPVEITKVTYATTEV